MSIWFWHSLPPGDANSLLLFVWSMCDPLAHGVSWLLIGPMNKRFGAQEVERSHCPLRL